MKSGFEQTTMDRIAQEAELAKGTLYLYFKSREELLLTLVLDDLDELIEMIETVVRRKEPADKKLLHCTTAFYRYSQENHFFYQLMTQLKFRPGCGMDDVNDETMARFQTENKRLFDLMSSVLQEGVDTGIFVLDHPIPYVVMQLMVSLKGTMVILKNNMIPMNTKRPSDEKIMHDVAALMIKGLQCQNV